MVAVRDLSGRRFVLPPRVGLALHWFAVSRWFFVDVRGHASSARWLESDHDFSGVDTFWFGDRLRNPQSLTLQRSTATRWHIGARAEYGVSKNGAGFVVGRGDHHGRVLFAHDHGLSSVL